MSASTAPDLTDDAALGGRLRLLQPRKGHRFGHDAILLAAAVPARGGELAIDLGAGVGCAGLALATRVPGVRVALAEIDPALVALAAQNVQRNALADRAGALTLDVTASAEAFAHAGLAQGSADHVLMNPPFYDAARVQASPDAARRAAHLATADSFSAWVRAAAWLLRPGGMLTVIYRADARDAVLAALAPAYGAVKVLPVYPGPDAAAIRIVVQAVRGMRGGAENCTGLQLNDKAGRPALEAEIILREASPLVFVPASAVG